MTRNSVLVSVLIGILTSVVGTVIYTYVGTLGQPAVFLGVGLGIFVLVLAGLIFVLRGKWYLLRASGISAFYPRGQAQCERAIVRELSKTTKAVFIGARGMDLMGEKSPFVGALVSAKNLQSVDIFLLSPGGKNARLRSQHLDVEKNKYEAELHAVDNFLGTLSIREQVPLTKYSYTDKPLLRLIETDKSAWVAFYRSGVRGRDLAVFRILRDSVAYREIEKYRDNLRANADMRDYSAEGPQE